ncbi:adenine-specific methyltransferase EcoRI family protein [uncultured Flavobacterium sp.]|uniref:adenine-specific methyltransferase EcoRI family protein n=1 Tax=uncultured Flavobacterium sp. TaxID=165435 RepID=UPI00262A4811|nr:adenine-specific methyltransferase EcoRI family protein [uncultured Flavobacterium sp.]
MRHKGLAKAKKSKADEFYTQYIDIEKEVNAYLEYNPNVFKDKTILLPCDDPEWSNFTKYFAQNFERFGLKKLISTSYAQESKSLPNQYQPSLFEVNDPKFDEYKTNVRGKIFKLDHDKSGDGKIDINDLEWEYLDGDGDFNSDEVKKLRDEADIIITNPPFSIFREFMQWIFVAQKQFLVIANINAITYKEIFPLIRENKIWLGTGMGRWISGFIVPDSYQLYGTEAKIDNEGNRIVATNNCLWFTNLDHGKRHQPLPLMTMADNIRYSSHKDVKGKEYRKYDNFDAIEIPFTDSIPSDYDGVMGVPITFLDKYNPEQFEILGCSYDYGRPIDWDKSINMSVTIGGENVYKRLLIKHKK